VSELEEAIAALREAREKMLLVKVTSPRQTEKLIEARADVLRAIKKFERLAECES
jgi:hypothetical protein